MRRMKLKHYLKHRKLILFKRKQRKKYNIHSVIDRKAQLIASGATVRQLKKFYYANYRNYGIVKKKIAMRKLLAFLIRLRLPLYLNFGRWLIVDFLRGKVKKFNGIFCFVAMPGEGKTISMVNHIEKLKQKIPKLYVATNFNYTKQDQAIVHWTDIIKVSKYCVVHKLKYVTAIDEIHVTFDSTNYKDFPQELLSILSFNRKFSMQFLCSAQIYDRIPKKIKDIANYIIICKNVLSSDRLFINYYFKTLDYEAKFSGKRKKADFITQFVAGDDIYACYDTLEQVDRMVENAQRERDKREEALTLLFGKMSSSLEESEPCERSESGSDSSKMIDIA